MCNPPNGFFAAPLSPVQRLVPLQLNSDKMTVPPTLIIDITLTKSLAIVNTGYVNLTRFFRKFFKKFLHLVQNFTIARNTRPLVPLRTVSPRETNPLPSPQLRTHIPLPVAGGETAGIREGFPDAPNR